MTGMHRSTHVVILSISGGMRGEGGFGGGSHAMTRTVSALMAALLVTAACALRPPVTHVAASADACSGRPSGQVIVVGLADQQLTACQDGRAVHLRCLRIFRWVRRASPGRRSPPEVTPLGFLQLSVRGMFAAPR